MSEDGSVDSFEEFGGDGVDYNPLFVTTTCFADRDKAFDWASKIAEDNGFALVKANNGAKNKTEGLLASYFRCYRYGKSNGVYDPENPKKPRAQKCGCEFRIRVVQNYHYVNNKEVVLWNIKTAKGFGCHNHQLTKYKDGHRHYAGLDEKRESVRRATIPCGGERNPAQQMLALAVDANYVHWHETNPETHELTHVFMSHPEAVKMFHAYPHVVLIDSTYKTNFYKVTLVEVVGVTPEEGYTWLLQKLIEILECTGASPSAFVTDRELGLIAALRIVFSDTPHLLCHWHLNRAVESRATSMFNSGWYKNQILRNEETGWWKVINATNEEYFKEAWCSFSNKPLKSWRLKLEEVLSWELGWNVDMDVHFKPLTAYLVLAMIYMKNEGKREHLSDVHEFWRTLEYDGNEAMPKNDNDMLEEFIEKARKSDLTYRKVFLEKMRDILHPEDEKILPPAVRENPKGRPRNSTTRSKSNFEHSQRKYGTPSTDASTNVGHRSIDFPPGPSGAPLERNFTIGLLSTWNKRFGVPEDLWGHFDGWVDVGNDGHCGY
ncbi:hypothetical protein RND81_07G094100 [Saponaria officinalis]|uniref:Protein FAR1-RELATED SEQUENCE n=1 Tax=Saponaria officinalis TaxID=3572 RepID=A0AAW1JNH7_SAPOF